MNPKAVAALLLSIGFLVLLPTAANAQIRDAVTLVVSPADNAIVLGEGFDIAIEVTNNASEPTPPLVIHIDITDPTSAHSVDPEDWTDALSASVGVIEGGQTRTVDWHLQPISGGTYTIYAVALAPGATDTTVSNIAAVDVADQRSLNPGGILPVAIAAPALTGGLLAFRIHRNRRTSAGAHRRTT